MKFFAKWFSTNEANSRAGSTARFLCLTDGLQARSQFASSRRSCDRPNGSRISVIFLATKAKAQLASKLHFVLCDSQAAIQTLDFSSKLSPHSALKIRRTFPLDSPNSAQIL
jgi:hypothetical protein